METDGRPALTARGYSSELRSGDKSPHSKRVKGGRQGAIYVILRNEASFSGRKMRVDELVGLMLRIFQKGQKTLASFC
jgi:hypothetical protein